MLKKTLSRMALVLFGLLIGLIALELAFRLLYPDPTPKLINQALQLHELYGVGFTPNAQGWNTSLRGEYSTYVTINNKGLRGKEYSYTKNPNTSRLLVLGDSFTAALQVDEAERFTTLLEQQLNEQDAAANIEVINAGIVGYGTANQLAYFSHEGLKYQPDIVLLMFFTGNDILDNINPSHYKLKDGQLSPIPVNYNPNFGRPAWLQEGTFFRNARNYLYIHSRLYSVSIELLAYTVIQQFPGLTNLLQSAGFVEATRPVINAGNIYAYLQPTEKAWAMTEALLVELNQQVQQRGSRLMVVVIPDETEVDTAKWDKLFKEYPDLFNSGSSQKPTQRFATFLEQNNIPYLQLQPALARYQQEHEESLYFQYDGHWKPAGHLLTAQEIYNFLNEAIRR